MANEDEEYVLAVIESREPNDYSLMCTVETYERAKEYEKQLHADGVMDTIIIPPFTSDKVKPNETADYFSLMCTVETYERAKEYEKQLHADGVMDTIIIPPFTSDKVKPNETADYFRSYYNQ